MARKLGIVAGAVVLGALGFSLGGASARSGITSPIAFTVFEHSTTDKVIDVGKKGDSTGDILTFHNKLYDETDTTKVGTLQGQCVRESPSAGTWECWWTMSLRGPRTSTRARVRWAPRWSRRPRTSSWGRCWPNSAAPTTSSSWTLSIRPLQLMSPRSS